MSNRRDINTSPIQLETLRPIHIGNYSSTATEWLGRQPCCPVLCPVLAHYVSTQWDTGRAKERG